jgi:hypothetical protein
VTFWDSPEWAAYEKAYGDAVGTRSRLLASADWQTRVVDLSLSEAELWQGIRRSYKALIHKVEREHVIGSVSGDCIYSAMKIHEQEAGRMTRPFETWTLMGDWVRAGHGLLIGAGVHRAVEITTAGDQWPRFAPVGLVDMRGYVYCVIHGAWSYYHSGVTREKNLSHAMLWQAMKALKARGVRYLELGWQARAGDTDKDRGISHLKAGMGGYDIPAREAPELCG